MLKYAWLIVVTGVAVGAARIVLGARALRADTAPSVAVNPATRTVAVAVETGMSREAIVLRGVR